MSLTTYSNQIRSLENNIANLQKQLSQINQQQASCLKRKADLQKRLDNKSKISLIQLSQFEKQLAQLVGELSSLAQKESNLRRQILGKENQLIQCRKQLQKEQDTEEKKRKAKQNQELRDLQSHNQSLQREIHKNGFLKRQLYLSITELNDAQRNQQILEIIQQGEGLTVEFKSSAYWDLKQGKKNKELKKEIVRTVIAFLNTQGGDLLIGVDNDGNIVGIEHDYKLLGSDKQNRDGYQLFLTDLILRDHLGYDYSPLISYYFYHLDNREICQISVQPCDRKTYYKESNEDILFVRVGNSTRKLSVKEAIEYWKARKIEIEKNQIYSQNTPQS